MNIVEMEGVSKRFGDVVAVDRVSLGIRQGEVFGLLGPNGAGKTTAINILIGLVRMDTGKVSVLGRDLTKHLMKVRRDIGIVPQELAIYEDLTSRENVKFFAGLYGLGGRELDAAATEALERSGLSDNTRGVPKRFSGGMKRRLNIACAIAHKPKLLVMDEPTVGIDPQSRRHILQSVKELNAEGCTIIYTSHYMEEVEEVAGRIAIMDHGKIIALGTKDELEALITDTNVLCVTVTGFADRVEPGTLKEIPGVRGVDIEDQVVRVSIAREVNALERIIAYFTSSGIPIRNIRSSAPNLETVFLSLTGRSLRD